MKMTFSNRVVWWIFNLLAGLFIGSASQASAAEKISSSDGGIPFFVAYEGKK